MNSKYLCICKQEGDYNKRQDSNYFEVKEGTQGRASGVAGTILFLDVGGGYNSVAPIIIH